MNTFIGRKTIQTKPMTKKEFTEYKGFSETIGLPPETEGYLVKYEDGYESWSPKEPFDKAYKKADTVLDRLIIERDELKTKLEAGHAALAQNNVPQVAIADLVCQLGYMDQYLSILEVRIQKILGHVV